MGYKLGDAVEEELILLSEQLDLGKCVLEL